jgi:hypothetical protein
MLQAVAASGKWTALGATTIQLDTYGAEIDFCQRGDRLDLTGDLGALTDPPGRDPFGFDIPDLRTLSLARADAGSSGAPTSATCTLPPPAATVACPSVAACGGDPTGSWRVISGQDAGPGGSICLDAPPSGPAQAPCSDLVYLPGDSPVQQVKLALTNTTPTDAILSLRADHTYTMLMSTNETDTVNFEPYCLTAYGANPTCAEVAAGVGLYIDHVADLNCRSAVDGVCSCSLAVSEETTQDNGTWQQSGGGVLTFASQQAAEFPVDETSYCVSGTELHLASLPGWGLFGNGPGTMTLERVP